MVNDFVFPQPDFIAKRTATPHHPPNFGDCKMPSSRETMREGEGRGLAQDCPHSAGHHLMATSMKENSGHRGCLSLELKWRCIKVKTTTPLIHLLLHQLEKFQQAGSFDPVMQNCNWRSPGCHVRRLIQGGQTQTFDASKIILSGTQLFSVAPIVPKSKKLLGESEILRLFNLSTAKL